MYGYIYEHMWACCPGPHLIKPTVFVLLYVVLCFIPNVLFFKWRIADVYLTWLFRRSSIRWGIHYIWMLHIFAKRLVTALCLASQIRPWCVSITWCVTINALILIFRHFATLVRYISSYEFNITQLHQHGTKPVCYVLLNTCLCALFHWSYIISFQGMDRATHVPTFLRVLHLHSTSKVHIMGANKMDTFQITVKYPTKIWCFF